MDRQTVYAGQIPLETDILHAGQYAMVGLAKFAAGVLGTSTIVNGFTCTPTGPASLNVIVTAGEIYQLENLEQSSWSSLGTDTHTILKQGIVLDPTTFGIVPPGTVGFSQNFLVECQYQDIDGGSTVLPYFDAALPSLPFSGPGNAGTSQNTVRKGVAALQVKAGTAAATGTQTTPTPDAGWTGMFVVTVANGAATITSGNISTYSAAPFIPAVLPQIPFTVLNGNWVYGVDTSTTVGTVTVSVTASGFNPQSYVAGMRLRVKMANDCTGAGALVINLNGIGNKTIVKTPGSQPLVGGEWKAGDVVELTYDGTNFQGSGLGQRAPLTAPVNLYVNGSIGSDTLYDGSSATHSAPTQGPFATITKALAVVSQFAPGTFGATINLAASQTFTGPFSTATWAHCNVTINGGGASTIITAGGSVPSVLFIDGPNNYTLTNFTINSTSNYNGAVGLYVHRFATVIIGAGIVLGAMTSAPQPSQIYVSGTLAVTATVTISGTPGFAGNYGSCFVADAVGSIGFNQSIVAANISVPITVAYFVEAVNLAIIAVGLPNPTWSNAGNVTGPKFLAETNGVIQTQSAGINYFPGTVAGTITLGGQYA